MTTPQATAARDELFLGGRLHGQRLPVDPTAARWVDVLSATTYRRGHVTTSTVHRLTGQPHQGWIRELMVHETITDRQILTALADVLVSE